MKKHLHHQGKVRLVTVILTILVIPFFSWNTGFAQMTVDSGTTVKVTNASFVNSMENLVMTNGGKLNVQGTLILKKNLVNQNSMSDTLGSGLIILSGNTHQTVSGQNVIQNLTVDNSKGVTIAGNTKVNGALTLTNGIVSLGSYNLSLGSSATIAGTPSSTRMIAATGTGELRKEFTGTGSFTFPVGDSTSVADYSPVTVSYTAGTFATGNYTGVNLSDAKYPDTETSYLTRFWNVSQSGVTNFASNATFQYVPGDVEGDEADIFCTRVLPMPFVTYGQTDVVNHKLEVHGLSSFGTFTGNLGNGSVPPGIRSIQDKNIANGQSTCADATQTLIIAGNGTYYTVQSGGSATHIAGQKITYFPGTRVFSGGYMHGYISTTSYCNPPNPILSPVIAGNINEGAKELMGNAMFKIYPNPTPGDFTVELKGDLPEEKTHIEIYGMLGDRIMTKDIMTDRKQSFTLSGKPVGVYVVHVTTGTVTKTEKIIKK
jgi:hypothetical protein